MRRELDRVRDEVVEQLRDPAAIADCRGEPVGLERQLDLLRVRRRLCSLGRLGEQLIDVCLGEGQLETAGVDLDEEEQLVHEGGESFDVPADRCEELTLLVRELVRILLEDHLQIAADRGQWGSQLV